MVAGIYYPSFHNALLIFPKTLLIIYSMIMIKMYDVFIHGSKAAIIL